MTRLIERPPMRGTELTSVVLPAGIDVPARSDAAKTFLLDFTRELYREISWRTKFLTLLIFVGLVGGLLYADHAGSSRRRAQEERTASLIAAQSQRIDQQEKGLLRQKDSLAGIEDQLAKLQAQNEDSSRGGGNLVDPLSLASRVWSDYHGGVCLIAGSYILLDPGTGLPLRYPENAPTEEEQLLTTGTKVTLTPMGNGEIFTLEFVGTGFHVGEGYVLTNRHVIDRPWTVNHEAEYLIAVTGATPRLNKLTAYFPHRRAAIAMRYLRSSDVVDLAVSRFDRVNLAKSVPALPLATGEIGLRVGDPVISMGFPTGPGRLVALLPPAEAEALSHEYGGSLLPLLDQLAGRDLIKPLTSQGQITDLYRDRVVFDARLSEGASGSPILNRNGQVVAIAFAEYLGESGSNFAIALKRELPLLRDSGWHPPPIPTTP